MEEVSKLVYPRHKRKWSLIPSINFKLSSINGTATDIVKRFMPTELTFPDSPPLLLQTCKSLPETAHEVGEAAGVGCAGL